MPPVPARRKAFRLPRRFNRPVTKQTRAFVARTHQRRKNRKREQWNRSFRRATRLFTDWRKLFTRWLGLGIAGSFIAVLCLLLFLPIAQVREIRVVRSDVRIDVERIQRALAPVFGRHLVFLPNQEVRELITKAAPDITDLTIDKQYPSRLVITLDLEPITAKLQIEAPDATEEEGLSEDTGSGGGIADLQTFDYLTVSGRYVAQPSGGLPSDLPIITVVDWGVRPQQGELLIQPELLEDLYTAEQAVVEQFGLPVSGRIVFLRAREFHLQTPEYSLWFDRGSSLEEQLGRFKLFLETTPLTEVSEYIDLRLTARIVYR